MNEMDIIRKKGVMLTAKDVAKYMNISIPSAQKRLLKNTFLTRISIKVGQTRKYFYGITGENIKMPIIETERLIKKRDYRI